MLDTSNKFFGFLTIGAIGISIFGFAIAAMINEDYPFWLLFLTGAFATPMLLNAIKKFSRNKKI